MSDRVTITVTQIPDNVQVLPDHTNEIVRVTVSSEGATGPTGPAGPNTVTTSTTTTITGLLKGNGATVSAATAGTDYLTPTGNGSGLTGLVSAQITDATNLATANKVVRRDAQGSASFESVSIGATGIFCTGAIEADSLNIQGLNYRSFIAEGPDTLTQNINLYVPTEGGKYLATTDTSDGTPNYADAANSANYATEAGTLQTSRTIFGQSFNGSANVNGNLLTNGHLASVPSGGEAGHIITLNGTAPTVVAGRSAWFSDASGNPSYRNGIGAVETLIGSADLGTNVATFLATPTSANLAAAITNETGSGSLVFATSPTITTPTLSRTGAGTVFTATDATCSLTMVTDSSGRNFLTSTGTLGSYVTSTANNESFVYVNALSNSSDQRVMRFGNTGNRFSVQRLNNANSSVLGTPFSLANVAPSDSFYMNTSGGVGFGTTSDAGAGGIQTAGKIIAGNTVRLKGYTFATLPTPTQGDTAFITDGAAVPIFMANAAGGGTTVTKVFYNGTNWING